MNRPGLVAFPDRDAAAEAATDRIAEALKTDGARSLVVTGGGTPGPVYDRLSRLDLSWDRITVTLSDDRWVDPSRPESNERLLRERLFVGRAAAAGFLPLKGDGPTPDADAAAAEPRIAALMPFAAVLLGLGNDGHVASLFPGAPRLGEDLDPEGPRLCVGVAMSGLEPFLPRVSLTVRALLGTTRILLLATGDEKRLIVERTLDDPSYDPPVAALLRQDRTPVSVLWAP